MAMLEHGCSVASPDDSLQTRASQETGQTSHYSSYCVAEVDHVFFGLNPDACIKDLEAAYRTGCAVGWALKEKSEKLCIEFMWPKSDCWRASTVRVPWARVHNCLQSNAHTHRASFEALNSSAISGCHALLESNGGSLLELCTRTRISMCQMPRSNSRP
eukprot:43143-Amphidinium_carterae.1